MMSSSEDNSVSSHTSSAGQHSTESSISSQMDIAELMGVEIDNLAAALPNTEAQRALNESRKGTKIVKKPQTSQSSNQPLNYLLPLQAKLGSLLEQGTFSDVKFLIGPGKNEQVAHKLILAVSSPVFASMFFSALESHNVVEIPDCTYSAFQALLRYIYTNTIHDLTAEEAINALYAARKYSILGLEDICLVTLGRGVNSENVFQVLEVAKIYELPALESVCWEHIEENAKEVITTHLFSLDISMLSLLLKNDRLNIPETDLFDILVQWSKHECEREDVEPNLKNQRKIIEPVLKDIRFGNMKASDFTDKIVPTSLLTTNEVAQILTHLTSSDNNKELLKDFNPTLRVPRVSKQPPNPNSQVCQYFKTNEADADGGATGSRRNRRSRRRNRQWV